MLTTQSNQPENMEHIINVQIQTTTNIELEVPTNIELTTQLRLLIYETLAGISLLSVALYVLNTLQKYPPIKIK